MPCFSSLAEVRDALPDLGLSERQRDDIILGLRVEHYCEGPCASRFIAPYTR